MLTPEKLNPVVKDELGQNVFAKLVTVDVGLAHPYATVLVKDGVAILAVDDDGQVLLIKSVRPSVGLVTWEIPRGGVEVGEAALHTAWREFTEETGLVVSPESHWVKLVGPYHVDNGILASSMTIFYTRVKGVAPEPTEQTDGEALAYQWVGVKELLEAINGEEVTDSVTLMAVFRGLAEGFLSDRMV